MRLAPAALSLWCLLAINACDKGSPKHVEIENVCELGGQRVVVEGFLDADPNMGCADRKCDFSLRDHEHSVILRVTIPDGYNAITARSFIRVPRGKKFSARDRIVVTGTVVAKTPPCRIELETATQ